MANTYTDALIKAKLEERNRAIDRGAYVLRYGSRPTWNPQAEEWDRRMDVWCAAMAYARETL